MPVPRLSLYLFFSILRAYIMVLCMVVFFVFFGEFSIDFVLGKPFWTIDKITYDVLPKLLKLLMEMHWMITLMAVLFAFWQLHKKQETYLFKINFFPYRVFISIIILFVVGTSCIAQFAANPLLDIWITASKAKQSFYGEHQRHFQLVDYPSNDIGRDLSSKTDDKKSGPANNQRMTRQRNTQNPQAAQEASEVPFALNNDVLRYISFDWVAQSIYNFKMVVLHRHHGILEMVTSPKASYRQKQVMLDEAVVFPYKKPSFNISGYVIPMDLNILHEKFIPIRADKQSLFSLYKTRSIMRAFGEDLGIVQFTIIRQLWEPLLTLLTCLAGVYIFMMGPRAQIRASRVGSLVGVVLFAVLWMRFGGVFLGMHYFYTNFFFYGLPILLGIAIYFLLIRYSWYHG